MLKQRIQKHATKANNKKSLKKVRPIHRLKKQHKTSPSLLQSQKRFISTLDNNNNDNTDKNNNNNGINSKSKSPSLSSLSSGAVAENTKQPIDSYSTHHSQIVPWKRWAVSELLRQGIIPSKHSMGNNNNETLQRVQNFDGLSPKALAMMENVDLNLNNDNKLIFVWNLTDFKRQLKSLKSSFPSNWLHTVATKANPLQTILQTAKNCGVGAEAASLGELKMALTVHEPENVIFDCPSKTIEDIKFTLESGVGLTIDNLGEIARVDAVLQHYNIKPRAGRKQPIGLRINPQIGVGELSTYSVSKPYSKFGIPITEEYNDIIQTYLSRPYMNMLHVHAGSQSYSMEQIAIAIRRVLDLANTINEQSAILHKQNNNNNTPYEPQIQTIDIGGGLMTNFTDEKNTPDLQEWRQTLEQHCPELFTGQYKVITELGRRLLAKQGFVLSQIEYVKTAGGRRILLQHVGADIAVRTVYKPASWPLRVNTFCGTTGGVQHLTLEDQQKLLNDELLYADVAGPCCIDDVLAPNLRPLPGDVQSGDFILFHDTGAYYHSAYSYYNMRTTPALYAFEEPEHWEADMSKIEEENTSPQQVKDNNGVVQFEKFRTAGTIDDVVNFFMDKKTE